MKNNNLAIAVAVGLCFFAAALAASVSFYKVRKPQKTISVVGLAEQDFTSDLIVWNLNLSSRDDNMQKAYAGIKDRLPAVRQFLKDKGIADTEMKFFSITNEPEEEYRWDEKSRTGFRTFEGYRASQRIRVESKDIEKVERAIRDIAELYDRNIFIESSEPEYYYTKLADLKIEMLAGASKDARNRAETITKNAGSRLAGLKTANMGVFQITAPNSDDDSYTWGGAFNTASKQKRASINMRLTYYVK